MNRRHFLQRLAAVVTLGMGALPVVAVARQRSDILLQDSPLAGFQFHQAEQVWPQLAIGQPLTLHRDPHNNHDHRAIAVYWQEQQLGYVPRRCNYTLAQLLDNGRQLRATISQLKPGPSPWERLRMRIELGA